MQKFNIIFISSLLIASNNFGMDLGIVTQDSGKKLAPLTILEKAEIFSMRSKTMSLALKEPRQVLESMKSMSSDIAGNVMSNTERRLNQSADPSEWVLSLSSDSNRNLGIKKLHQELIKTNESFSLFDSDGGKYVVGISTDSDEYIVFKEMLNNGTFDPNMCDKNGEPLLNRLIKQTKDYTKIKDVLASGVSVNAVDKEGKTSLWYAITLKDQEMIDMLLHYGAVVHINMLADQNLFLGKIFCLQQCYSCNIHPENMSNIPCINRHIGMFICEGCYNISNAKCPLCRRSLDEYGK